MIFEYASQAGGIYQAKTGISLKRRKLDIHHLYVFFIGWIFSFRGEGMNVAHVNLGYLTIEESYNGSFFFPILKAGNDRSDRYDANGKNGFTDKTIDEGTLPCLELAEG